MDNPTGPQRSSSQPFSLDRLLSLEVTGPLGPGMGGVWSPTGCLELSTVLEMTLGNTMHSLCAWLQGGERALNQSRMRCALNQSWMRRCAQGC